MTRSFCIPGLPLYWRTTDHAHAPLPPGIPARADFEFAFDGDLGLIRQRVSPTMAETLNNVYRAEANVGYLQVGQSLADGYGRDLWAFIAKALPLLGTNRKVLEIGCGGCYILDLFVKANYDAIGIDPSPIAVRTAAQLGFQVIEGFFPHPKAEGPFGLILHSDVLEHMDDPVRFLRLQRERLAPGGMIIAAVPDCTTSNAAGDLSMIIHQHINFFDRESLAATFRAAGLVPIAIERSNYGGSLYCLAQRSDQPIPRNATPTATVYERFCDQAQAVSSRFAAIVTTALAQGRRVGCYVPLRAFPYLAISGHLDQVRLFDDSAEMAYRYFDGVPRQVETFTELTADPPDLTLVMSYTFGHKIRDKIVAAIGARTEVISLTDMSHG